MEASDCGLVLGCEFTKASEDVYLRNPVVSPVRRTPTEGRTEQTVLAGWYVDNLLQNVNEQIGNEHSAR
jgi:hypothetical protein